MKFIEDWSNGMGCIERALVAEGCGGYLFLHPGTGHGGAVPGSDLTIFNPPRCCMGWSMEGSDGKDERSGVGAVSVHGRDRERV